MDKYKESIDLIIESLNDIHTIRLNPKSGRFELITIDDGRDTNIFKIRYVRLSLAFKSERNGIQPLIRTSIELRHEARKQDDIVLENFYRSFLDNLIRFMLFAKDTNNLVNGDNNPVIIKRIQTLMEE